jgi:hypothetical protein
MKFNKFAVPAHRKIPKKRLESRELYVMFARNGGVARPGMMDQTIPILCTPELSFRPVEARREKEFFSKNALFCWI